MMKIVFEQPTFPKWKETHRYLLDKDPIDYKQKEDTRKSYIWIVLSEIKYDISLLDVKQDTWFRGKGGSPTASGTLKKHWIDRSRHLFLLQAESKSKSENYISVFSASGKFITAYCPTRCDVPSPVFPLSVTDCQKLCRLSLLCADRREHIITCDDVLSITSGKMQNNREMSFKKIYSTTIPRGVELGLIAPVSSEIYKILYDHVDLLRELRTLNPLFVPRE